MGLGSGFPVSLHCLRPVVWLLALVGLLPITASAQERPLSYQGSIGLTVGVLAEPVAGTGGSVGVQVGFSPRLFRVLVLHVEGGIEYLGPVCFEEGAACEAARARSSDTFMASGAVALGLLTPPFHLGTRSEGVDVAVGLLAGREGVVAGLGAGDCLNCRAAGVNLRGGFFVAPTLEVWFLRDVGVGTSFRFYDTAADVQRRLTVCFLIRAGA
jgi:hypothetical protein